MTKKKKEEKSSNREDIQKILMKVIYYGEYEKVKYAIENGADVNAETKTGRTPLIQACDDRNDLMIVKLLLEKGAKVNQKEKNRETPLTYACMYGNLEIVKVLIDAGADVNQPGGYERTPLMFASSPPYWTDDHLEIVKLLIENGADLNAVNAAKDSILTDMTFSKETDMDILKYLLDAYPVRY